MSKRLLLKIGRYSHARQFKRMRREVKKLKLRMGRVVRDIERKIADRPEVQAAMAQELSLAKRALAQKRTEKNKLYSIHAPEVVCVSKGKAHKRYEFGVKASIATTNHSGFVVGARSYPGNPYDGHTLADQLEQVEILTGIRPKRCYADRGYPGHGVETTDVFISGQKRGVTRTTRKELKRRSAIEAEIGQMKSDGLLGRNYLKGQEGDAIKALLTACGYNLPKLLAWFRSLWPWILAATRQAITPWLSRIAPPVPA